ncbi:putative nuclease HARBI1 [Plodia interpunctella]|uniref:putative nuclease HARBI1 n=1 Tax=Plodia interpunctella TaxID=58824 RepID=UPI00236873DE|nr:putative nuclease HARBI1 [Plodia interpunctella]
MAEKPPEEGYISVVDEEPEIFELLKWDNPPTQKQQDARPMEKAHSPEKRPPKAREECDPFDMQDPAFIEMFRLRKDLVRSLCDELKPVMPDSIKSIEFSVESKVLATLSFYASGKFQKTIGGKSDPAITQYFVGTAIQQVTEAMNHPTIVKKYMHFPHLRNERDVVKTRFYIKHGIPNVVGCIDCTHVPIARPDDDQKIHFNKSFHSKKVQIICDSECNVMSVDASPGGSMSYDAIFNRHAVKNDLLSLNHSGEQCFLIGGPYYTQKLYLMTPIPKITKKSPVSPEKYYSNIHSQAFNSVTETIKQLKSRWKCLQATCNKQFDPSSVAQMVVACCILHNICNRQGLPVPQMTQTEERLEAMKQKVANGPVPRKQAEDQSGIQARATLVERLWNERRVVPESSAPKKRMSKKDRLLEGYQNPQTQSHQSTHQNNVQSSQLVPAPTPQMHHDDGSKRPRILSMHCNPTYSLSMAPGWGHYPQQ